MITVYLNVLSQITSLLNPFQPSVGLRIETSHLICTPNQMTGFYKKCNTGFELDQCLYYICSKTIFIHIYQYLPKVTGFINNEGICTHFQKHTFVIRKESSKTEVFHHLT